MIVLPEIVVVRRDPSFTARERDVLSLYASGLGYSDIAERLGLKYNTIGCYLQKIRAKARLKGRADLVGLAIKEGILANGKRAK